MAGIVKGMRQRNEEPKLAAIGKLLEHMHQRTPHGGSRWSRSSVKNLLDRALEQKYLASDPAPRRDDAPDQCQSPGTLSST